MSSDLLRIENEAVCQIAECSDKESLESVRIKYLGRKGLIADLMAKIPSLPQEQRRDYGSGVNGLKNKLAALIAEKESGLNESILSGEKSEASSDITLPGKRQLLGRVHPIKQIESQICSTFSHLGFKIFQGPEIETEYNNFEALNIPLDHPSRDAFDTFYLKQKNAESLNTKERLLLRSHTSPAQIRAMKACAPPLAIIVPGRVYRPDAVDASHSFMFHQVEGFAVDKDVKFSDLKGVLVAFAKEMFGEKTKMRFRPSFFPFTEPSAEVDITCIICSGKGCSVCKKSGWLEILGCGMIHPHVFKSSGYDAKKWKGFAFGMGVERIAMLKFAINDIRILFENDIRFLEQF